MSLFLKKKRSNEKRQLQTGHRLFFVLASPVQFKHQRVSEGPEEFPNTYCPIRASTRITKIILIWILRDVWLHVWVKVKVKGEKMKT